MRENDYTGTPVDVDDDSAFLPADVDLYEFDPDDEALADEFAALEECEQAIRIGACAEEAKSLQEVAAALYDYADELTELASEGWELVDSITNGEGTAVQFSAIEDDLS